MVQACTSCWLSIGPYTLFYFQKKNYDFIRERQIVNVQFGLINRVQPRVPLRFGFWLGLMPIFGELLRGRWDVLIISDEIPRTFAGGLLVKILFEAFVPLDPVIVQNWADCLQPIIFSPKNFYCIW